jgi:hypothetical protein
LLNGLNDRYTVYSLYLDVIYVPRTELRSLWYLVQFPCVVQDHSASKSVSFHYLAQQCLTSFVVNNSRKFGCYLQSRTIPLLVSFVVTWWNDWLHCSHANWLHSGSRRLYKASF